MNLRTFTIPFFVFITGACVLVIEVVAMRILAPYFGNTMFTVSAVLSVVLAALSCGYYIGGKLADNRPEEKLFYGIIGSSGIVVILAYILGEIILTAIGYRLPLVEGPIIISILLFFPQSLLLGMVSPFAVKLHSLRAEALGIGSASGHIFFWSTIGSIAGSLAAGFFLIPTFGIAQIMIGTGLCLSILGFFAMFNIKNQWIKIVPMFILAIGSLYATNSATALLEAQRPGNVIYDKEGLYQRIIIVDGEYKGQPTRFLYQDRNTSAAEFRNSRELPYDYTKYYALYQLFPTQVNRALLIGGGAYSVPNILVNELPEAEIDVAEIEPGLFDIVKTHFHITDSPRLHNIVQDGRRVLHDSQMPYDYIFSDAYSSLYSSPSHLTTKEFFEMAKSKLSDNGVFIANVIGSLQDKPESVLFSEMRTFKSVFDNSYFFAVVSPSATTSQNFIFVGYKGTGQLNLASKAITTNSNPIIAGLAEKMIDISQFDLSRYPLLTDNYSPIEYLISKEFRRK